MSKIMLGEFIVQWNNGIQRYQLWGSIFKPDSQTTLGGFYMNVDVDDPYSGDALLELIKKVEDISITCTSERFTNQKVYRLKRYGKLNVNYIDKIIKDIGNFSHDGVFYKAWFEMKKTFRDIYNEAILDGL